MKTNTAKIFAIVIIIVGSFVNFFCTNMLLSDVSNMFHDTMFISSIPAFVFACYFVLALLYVLRLGRRSQYKKRMTQVNTTAWIIFASVGLISSVVSGIVVYKSFLAPYPFPGYGIIAIVVHLAALIFSIYWKIKASKWADDLEKRKKTFKHVLFTFVCVFIFYVAFNRFGALLWAPVYVQVRTLYLTWPVYVSFLIPLALLVHNILYITGVFVRKPAAGVVYDIMVILATLLLTGIVVKNAMEHTLFIAAVSPAFALDRLATKPIIIFVAFGIELAFGGYLLGLSIKLKGRIERGEPI